LLAADANFSWTKLAPRRSHYGIDDKTSANRTRLIVRWRTRLMGKSNTAAFLLSALVGFLAFATVAAAGPLSVKEIPLPRPRPTATALTIPAFTPPSNTAGVAESDVAAVKQAIEWLHAGKRDQATDIEKTISNPLARKVVEWAILRDDDNGVDFARYNAFLLENPGWPSLGMFRRRAEATLWQEQTDPSTVRAFFASVKPSTAKGRLALARALLAQGDRAGAQYYLREAWCCDAISHELEAQAIDQFRDILTRVEDKMRATSRLYANDNDGALRAALRIGGVELAIAQARAAVNSKSSDAKALLDAVPGNVRDDAGYVFSRVQFLRRSDQIAEAGQLMLAATRDPAQLSDIDEWWVERRLLARKLLDMGDATTAYLIVRDAVPPTKENYRVEHMFTAGWIALRFLDDPTTAAEFFARIPQLTQNPIALARGGYWMGRAFEAANKMQDARVRYEGAARHATAYYGQLARARLGLGELTLSAPPALTAERRAALAHLEIVRAAEILYAVNARDLVAPMVADLAEKVQDVGVLVMLAEIAGKFEDARSMHLIGKAALARGFAFDRYAFPTAGIPSYRSIGPTVEPAVVFSIVKQESAFNPLDVSSAKALGLMQVTPDAGRYVAKKFKVAFDQKRLLHDTVYNLQMGSAELGGVIEDYRGSYILAFAAYNAGSGRVREWLERYGDPRDPKVDPIDWVERIPFSETRNYVQRVLENLQVYRCRFSGGSRLMIEADLRRGAMTN
jgi:soluble lytic murein transglycosylase